MKYVKFMKGDVYLDRYAQLNGSKNASEFIKTMQCEEVKDDFIKAFWVYEDFEITENPKGIKSNVCVVSIMGNPIRAYILKANGIINGNFFYLPEEDFDKIMC